LVLLSMERSGADNWDVGPAPETHGEIRDFAAKSRFCTPKNYAINLSTKCSILSDTQGELTYEIHLHDSVLSGCCPDDVFYRMASG
jgi:hypothetical protein